MEKPFLALISEYEIEALFSDSYFWWRQGKKFGLIWAYFSKN